MAIFYPSLDKIKLFKVQPTEGESTLLNFLDATLDDSFEVFFNPYLNGDRPDVLIMRKDYGVMVNLEIQANQRDFLKIQTVCKGNKTHHIQMCINKKRLARFEHLGCFWAHHGHAYLRFQ